MLKLNPVFQFLAFLVILLVIAFFIQTSILENIGEDARANKILLSYVVNALLAGAIYMLLYYYRYKLKDYIGFLFMGGSFLKFILFFLFFYPSYRADGDISSLEFAAFFVPYLICLVLETIFTAKMLQNLD